MNKVAKFMEANEKSPVVAGSVTKNHGGRYRLYDGSVFTWSFKQMEEFLKDGGIFKPRWAVVT